jgi:uncharacterized membrane protein YfcA
VPLQFALALYVLMDLANAFRIGFENPKHALRDEWKRLVPTILLGTAVGATLLLHLPRKAATLALGVFVLAFALYSSRATRRRGRSFLRAGRTSRASPAASRARCSARAARRMRCICRAGD